MIRKGLKNHSKNTVRKTAGLLLSLTLASASLLGCGSAKAGNTKENAADNPTAETKNVETAAETTAETKADTTASDEKVKLRIGYFTVNNGTPELYAAESEGYLKEELGENVEIEYIGFSNGPAANEAFLAGEIDFQNGMGDLPVLNGWRNGLDTKVIAQTGSLGANTGLVVSDKSGIDAVEELKGKNVGVYIGTSFHKSVLGILSDHGLSAGDVNLVNIDSTSDGIAALASGELDAYYVASTFYVDYAKENNIGELLEDSSNYPSYGYLIGSSKYIDEHPEVVKGLVKAFERGADFINQDKKAGAKAVSDFLKTEYDQAYSTLSNENVTVYLDDGAVENLFRAEKFLNSIGAVEVELSEDQILEHVDKSFLD